MAAALLGWSDEELKQRKATVEKEFDEQAKAFASITPQQMEQTRGEMNARRRWRRLARELFQATGWIGKQIALIVAFIFALYVVGTGIMEFIKATGAW